MQFSASVRSLSVLSACTHTGPRLSIVRLNVTIPKAFVFFFCYMRHCQIWFVKMHTCLAACAGKWVREPYTIIRRLLFLSNSSSVISLDRNCREVINLLFVLPVLFYLNILETEENRKGENITILGQKILDVRWQVVRHFYDLLVTRHAPYACHKSSHVSPTGRLVSQIPTYSVFSGYFVNGWSESCAVTTSASVKTLTYEYSVFMRVNVTFSIR